LVGVAIMGKGKFIGWVRMVYVCQRSKLGYLFLNQTLWWLNVSKLDIILLHISFMLKRVTYQFICGGAFTKLFGSLKEEGVRELEMVLRWIFSLIIGFQIKMAIKFGLLIPTLIICIWTHYTKSGLKWHYILVHFDKKHANKSLKYEL